MTLGAGPNFPMFASNSRQPDNIPVKEGALGTREPEAAVGVRAAVADLVHGLGCRAGAILTRGVGNVSMLAVHGLSEEAVASYVSTWHRRDPWLEVLGGPPSGRAVRGEDLVGPRLLKGSEFHERWLVPNGLGSAGFAEIGHADDPATLLCVWRAAGEKSLSASDTQLLRAAAGILGLALRRHEPNAGAIPAEELLARSSVPIVILRGDCTILWANAAAATLWSDMGPLRRVGSRLCHRNPAHARRFAELVADATATPARSAIVGLQSGNGMLPVKLQPLVLRSGQAVVAISAGPPQAGVPNAAMIAAALGLTRAQAEVAALLCRGLETAAISEHIGISQNTLNGHLKDLYGRLQAANRVQAVVKVLAASAALSLLSPPAPSGRVSGSAD